VIFPAALVACSSDGEKPVSSENAAPPVQVEPTPSGNAFADHDPHGWDYLLEPPDFSQMDVVAVPAAEPVKPDSTQVNEPNSQD
jgi:hypothetical protein